MPGQHRRGNDAGDKEDFVSLPYNMKKLVGAVGFPQFESLEDDEARIYELVKHGRCMTCEKPLGQDANFIISRYGIVGGYCSGVCHSDMAIVGWLQEQHEDLTQKIDFRRASEVHTDEGEEVSGDVVPDHPEDDPAFPRDDEA